MDFAQKYSTKLSLINLVNTLLTSIDEGKITLGIFIDFKKAFDTINHDILLNKMSHYGIRGIPLKWFSDYLSNRSQLLCYKRNRFDTQNNNMWCSSRFCPGAHIIFDIYK